MLTKLKKYINKILSDIRNFFFAMEMIYQNEIDTQHFQYWSTRIIATACWLLDCN